MLQVVQGGSRHARGVGLGEPVAGAAVAVDVDQSRQQQPPWSRRRQVGPAARSAHTSGSRGPVGRRADPADAVVVDGHHGVVEPPAAADEVATDEHAGHTSSGRLQEPGYDVEVRTAAASAERELDAEAEGSVADAPSDTRPDSVSSSRPGVRRFQRRMTMRNST